MACSLPMSQQGLSRTVVLTLLTLVAFAGNSLLCRMALAGAEIDPVSFTAIRLATGALVLAPFLKAPDDDARWSLVGGFSLFVYALTFSLAYVTLDAGVGALLLFGAVQVTMLGVGFWRGERLEPWGLAGLAVAITGFLVQVLPSATAPEPWGALFMAAAGLSWGVYSLAGRGVAFPRTATARNFLLAAPAALVCLVLPLGERVFELRGVLLAIVSGAITSGLGYVLWYAALRGHGRTSAALVQLAVPVLAAGAGVLLLDEKLTPRLMLAAALTLGGIALAITAGNRRPGPREAEA